MQSLACNGVCLHYSYRAPRPGARTLVFANSLGTDLRIWHATIAHLDAGLGVLLYDKRGHGLSDIGATPYRIGDHVADLAALMDALHVRDAVACGLSIGGLVAQGLHAVRPDLTRALVLSDTAHRIGSEAMWNERIEAVLGSGIAAIADTILARWFTPGFRAGPGLAIYRNMLVRTPVAGYAGTCAALRDADYTQQARMVSVPTLCLVGDQDGSTPPQLVRSLAALIPGSRFEVIAGAGHLPGVEQPAAYARLIGDFVASLA